VVAYADDALDDDRDLAGGPDVADEPARLCAAGEEGGE
jgi:hypothetical protein